jgi:hypothetical protein
MFYLRVLLMLYCCWLAVLDGVLVPALWSSLLGGGFTVTCAGDVCRHYLFALLLDD